MASAAAARTCAAAIVDELGEAGGDDDLRLTRTRRAELTAQGASCLGRRAMLVETVIWAPSKSSPGVAWSAQTTAENMAEVLGKPLAVYSGFDPTAASLHAGNLVPLMLLTHLRRHGHQALPLVGGATGMIGDPLGQDQRADPPRQREGPGEHRQDPGPDRAVLRQRRRAAGQGRGQPRLARSGPAARLPARRRQALRGQPDDPARLGQGALRVARERDLVHRVLVHAAAGLRFPRAQPPPRLPHAGRRLRPVGEHRVGRRPLPTPLGRHRLRAHRASPHQQRGEEVRQEREGGGVPRRQPHLAVRLLPVLVQQRGCRRGAIPALAHRARQRGD